MWMRTVWPTRTCSPTARVPASESAPMIGRTRKSPRPYSGWFSSMTMPSIRPEAASCRSRRSSPAIASSIRSIADLEASSSITFACAAVIVISGPTGAAPCETQGSIEIPDSEHATAPPFSTSPSRNREAEPTAEALANPPRTGIPGLISSRLPSRASVAKL